MTKREYKIVVLGGDGIGAEVCDEALQLLRLIEDGLDGVRLNFEKHAVGAVEYLANGNALPESAFDACRNGDAVLLGAMGLPDVRYPDGREIAPQLDLRERLGLYGGIRPIRLFHENDTPLKGYGEGDIDFVIVRESTEGLFYGRDEVGDLNSDSVQNVMRVTRAGAERVCRLAFNVARQRNQRKHVTLVDKANVLSSMVYFRKVFDEVAAEFPDCTSDHVYVDAMALYLVRSPDQFDVMVTENMFGDILSDLAAGIVGGMGMAPSGDIGNQAAVFQPAHGSAPDIAGQGTANPIAMFLSAAMMLDWLDDPEAKRGGRALYDAVAQVLRNPTLRTQDMGGSLSTSDMTNEVVHVLNETFLCAENH